VQCAGALIEDPILMLGNDEKGQPQIIVKMPDGSETIVSDRALTESIIKHIPAGNNANIESFQIIPDDTVTNDQMNPPVFTKLPDEGIQNHVTTIKSDQLVNNAHTSQCDLLPSNTDLILPELQFTKSASQLPRVNPLMEYEQMSVLSSSKMPCSGSKTMDIACISNSVVSSNTNDCQRNTTSC
jgi:hypothetical protein